MSSTTLPTSNPRKKLALLYWGIILVLIIGGAVYWLIFWRFKEWTNDCYVEGNQVYITPLHHGFVTSIHTDDTFLVKKGEVLVELDKTDFLIEFDRAKENLAQVVREVCQKFHQVFVYRSEIEVRKASLIRDAQDFEHRLGVLAESGVSLEDYEHAVARLRTSYFSLQTTETLYEQALSLVQNTSVMDHPLVAEAADKMRDAWVNLYRCTIYSPVEGLAAQRTIQVGMWIPSGTPLMSVIPLDQIWVNANFKETQLRHMRIGQRAKITADLYGKDVVFHGRIVGLPGVAGNAVSLLPPQNLSGNWIKIVQRLPCRVALDPEELKEHPLRIGLSCEATVDLSDPGDLVPNSTKGSPLYETPIFEGEEFGDRLFIDSIIAANMDPSLMKYSSIPLEIIPIERLELGSAIKEALLANRKSPLAPPLPQNMQKKETIAPEIVPDPGELILDGEEEQEIVERVSRMVQEILREESVENLTLTLPE
jgi:membrane fusion protein (multidrug efflux system)